MPIKVDHWSPYRPAVEYAESLAEQAGGLCVELGPGNRPFRLATEFVGRDPQQCRDGYDGKFHQLNLSNESLPWGDGEVSFLFCRHTIEDLDDPEWCLSEIRRVARAGYIETPSPLAEMCRGVDAERAANNKRPPWRGYHHHRSFVWSGTTLVRKAERVPCLNVVGKFPFIEHVNLEAGEEALADLLNSGPLYWNTYHSWTGPLEYRIWRHEMDFEVGPSYGQFLERALKESQESCARFGNRPSVATVSE